MKTRTVVLGSALACIGGTAMSQGGHMADNMWQGGWFGGYGGVWMPILLVAVLVGVIVLIVRRK